MKNYKLKNISNNSHVAINNRTAQIRLKRQQKAPPKIFDNRFSQLLKICETMSNKSTKIDKKCIANKQKTEVNPLLCTDETIETILRSRQKGVQSSMSYRLQLPEIKEKQYQQEDSFTKEKSSCLTQRIAKKEGRQKMSMSTTLKTKSIKSQKSGKSTKLSKSRNNKVHKNSILSKEITPFDEFQKNINAKSKVSIDVRKLLLDRCRNNHSSNSNRCINTNSRGKYVYDPAKTNNQKMYSSINKYLDCQYN